MRSTSLLIQLKALSLRMLTLALILAFSFTIGESVSQKDSMLSEEQRLDFSRRVASLLQLQDQAPTRGADEDAKARAQCDRYFNNYILKCTGGEGGAEA